ncbi:MAG: hypothetical protein COV72_09215 [Candidatus Omnitrophica bacterium CG11_big_fil_rev_8_21_14_0_20_42_13]|uniref:Peptidase MA-like domain-containing protein n=1 Tax=Candidatus Ghiorseimicrobium undicola TaxID=1974746 RepID=A0A2H0LV57_9BACT|nr:MAG: hypothetical protein COV72_09215 [Candidatus Omnitrophica bacterium CG11_big_fil_rev_8_21_14_0_20_42_13]
MKASSSQIKPVNFILAFCFALSLFISGAQASNGNKWREKRSEHFIIYFKDVPVDFIEEIVKTAEDCYVQITQNLGFVRYNFWLWDNRAKFYIYNDKEHYLSDTRQPEWSAGAAQSYEKIIKTYPQMSGFFDSIMPHELGHIIFREFIGYKAVIPLWLEEGVASYQEKSKRLVADTIVKSAIKENRFIPLDKLSAMDIRSKTDKKIVELFYAESVSIVNFLIKKFGKSTFGWFCRDLKDDKPFEKALSRFGFWDIPKINKAWMKSLE